MKPFAKIVLLVCLIFWPATASLSDFQPVVRYSLPADIMQVDFGSETWVYRLYEDGTVKKLVTKKKVTQQVVATGTTSTQDHPEERDMATG
ncbi:MAG: hypothetical protein JRI36_09895 [Deltaproteobacteria bacterium]|nr:hypothetical protein [Deltaproteobacteria bacterium]